MRQESANAVNCEGQEGDKTSTHPKIKWGLGGGSGETTFKVEPYGAKWLAAARWKGGCGITQRAAGDLTSVQ